MSSTPPLHRLSLRSSARPRSTAQKSAAHTTYRATTTSGHAPQHRLPFLCLEHQEHPLVLRRLTPGYRHLLRAVRAMLRSVLDVLEIAYTMALAPYLPSLFLLHATSATTFETVRRPRPHGVYDDLPPAADFVTVLPLLATDLPAPRCVVCSQASSRPCSLRCGHAVCTDCIIEQVARQQNRCRDCDALLFATDDILATTLQEMLLSLRTWDVVLNLTSQLPKLLASRSSFAAEILVALEQGREAVELTPASRGLCREGCLTSAMPFLRDFRAGCSDGGGICRPHWEEDVASQGHVPGEGAPCVRHTRAHAEVVNRCSVIVHPEATPAGRT